MILIDIIRKKQSYRHYDNYEQADIQKGIAQQYFKLSAGLQIEKKIFKTLKVIEIPHDFAAVVPIILEGEENTVKVYYDVKHYKAYNRNGKHSPIKQFSSPSEVIFFTGYHILSSLVILR